MVRRALRAGSRPWWGQLGPLFVVVMIVTTVLSIGEAKAEHRVALVIGNNHYTYLDADRQLQKAVNDANAVGDALQHDGFTVLRGTDLTRGQIVDKLYELSALLKSGDTAVFYFAGHGVALGSGNFLIPTDVPDIEEGQEMRLANQSVSEADVIATLQEKGARVAIMILDSCRDNPFRKPGLRSIGLEQGLTRMPEANGVFSLYSAGYGQSALDRLFENDPNPNSVFTRVLVPFLTQPGLNLDDLAYEVRERVAHLAATTPDHHSQIPAAYNQIVGGRVYLASAATEPGPSDLPSASQPAAGNSTPALAESPSLDGSHGDVGTGHATAPPSATALSKTQTASLGTAGPDGSTPTPTPPGGPLLVLGLQAELNRLGCHAGAVTGAWDAQSRAALTRFSRIKKLDLDADNPNQVTYDKLRAEAAPGCPSSGGPVRNAVKAPVRQPKRIARRGESETFDRAIQQHSAHAGSCFQFNGQSVCE